MHNAFKWRPNDSKIVSTDRMCKQNRNKKQQTTEKQTHRELTRKYLLWHCPLYATDKDVDSCRQARFFNWHSLLYVLPSVPQTALWYWSLSYCYLIFCVPFSFVRADSFAIWNEKKSRRETLKNHFQQFEQIFVLCAWINTSFPYISNKIIIYWRKEKCIFFSFFHCRCAYFRKNEENLCKSLPAHQLVDMVYRDHKIQIECDHSMNYFHHHHHLRYYCCYDDNDCDYCW